MGTGFSLLDDLSACLSCQYLSDLKDPGLARELRRTLRAIPAARYSAAQWADALYYLTGTREAEAASAEKVREDLLYLLKHAGMAAL